MGEFGLLEVGERGAAEGPDESCGFGVAGGGAEEFGFQELEVWAGGVGQVFGQAFGGQVEGAQGEEGCAVGGGEERGGGGGQARGGGGGGEVGGEVGVVYAEYVAAAGGGVGRADRVGEWGRWVGFQFSRGLRDWILLTCGQVNDPGAGRIGCPVSVNEPAK